MTRPLHIQLIGIVVLSEHMGRSVASCMWGTHLGWVSMQTWSSCWRRDNKKTLVEVLKGNGRATQDRTRPKVAQQPTFLCSIPVSIVCFFFACKPYSLLYRQLINTGSSFLWYPGFGTVLISNLSFFQAYWWTRKFQQHDDEVCTKEDGIWVCVISKWNVVQSHNW